MKVAVRYQSRGGNTKAAAKIISETAGVEAKSITEPIQEYVDILFIGGGVYMMKADEKLIQYLKTLDSTKIGMIVPFSTTGGISVTNKTIKEYAKQAHIKVCDHEFCLRLMLQGHSALGREGGHLKEKQIKKVKKFAESVLKNK